MKEYIEREDAVKHLKSRTGQFIDDVGKGWNAGIEASISYIEGLPAADVAEVRHGKWVHPHWYNDVSCANCSECGFEAQHREYRGVQKYYKICPNCGARIDEEDVQDK